MIDAIGAIASVLLPWVAGTYAVRALWRRAPAVPALVAIGYGYFVGAFGATWLMRALSLAGIRWSLPTLGAAMLALGAVAWWLARRPAARLPHPGGTGRPLGSRAELDPAP